MSDAASSSRTVEPSPLPREPEQARSDVGSSHVAKPTPTLDAQPTVISSRTPLAAASVSDSANRILQGRILPGDQLGHFELLQYVGGGGMGRVFRALDTRLARSVALKVLSPEQAADRETVLRFQNEAQSAARLDHENIARVYYVGEDRGLHFIVFEFIEGVNIRELVEEKGPLPLADAVSYTFQAANALAHAAARNVVHRDIKPSNLLITPDGQVKLIDMGLARLREADNPAVDLTASGVTLGTFDYISPEQARDPRHADVRSDIYSLGCTFFFMLTGRPPFPEGTVLQKLLQHQDGQPPDVRQFRPELPDDIGRVLRKMLAKEPRQRYGTPAELLKDLLGLAGQVGVHPLAHGGKSWPAASSASLLLRRHLPWLLPLAALVCTVVALDIYWSDLARREVPSPPAPAGADEGYADAPDPRDFESEPFDPSSKNAPGNGRSLLPGSPASAKGPVTLPGHVAGGSSSTPAAKGPLALGSTGGMAGTQRPAQKILVGAKAPTPPMPVPPVANAAAPIEGQHKTAGPSGASVPPVATGPTKAAVRRSGVLIVGLRADGENEFASLADACAAAANGDVIELRYNGPREEHPLRLANLGLTIRAGQGFQPVVVFRGAEGDPLRYPRSMCALSSGRLTLINVALEFQLAREVPSDKWCLFETRGEQALRLEKCSLTIHNASDQLGAYHPDVAFFRLQAASASESAIDGAAPPAQPATIELVDCIARGEATLVLAEDSQPLRLAWQNGLLATTERLVSAVGGQRALHLGESLQLDLRHLTAVVRSGLCRLECSPAAPHCLGLQIYCADTILLAGPGCAVIEQLDDEDLDGLRQRVAWSGDRNFYEGFDIFWLVRRLDPETPPNLMTFDDWRKFWGPQRENLSRCGRVAWRNLPGADRPMHHHVPADYSLDDALSNNPALGTASDGRNAGLLEDRLPPLPSESVAEPPQKASRRTHLLDSAAAPQRDARIMSNAQ